ncbi:hypothetical protein J2853_009627 [Streptosporangium lutulentum]|uniref:SsgA family sporulation/cell division regulator n=1 Tax=Streptosporangium lutulentum TaxID=1461250 RepID=A0ABT9QU97_9ACTN|nr:hypothetical protein [Streptosporangium lutulentum]
MTVCFADRPNQGFKARAVYELTDPYAVQLQFPSPSGTGAIAWTFARDLLVQVVHPTCVKPVGEGDIRFGPAEAEDYIEIVLHPTGPQPSKLYARRDELTSFITQTYKRVPDGGEDDWIDWSAAWSRLQMLLGGAA